jgi:hypothetical protein
MQFFVTLVGLACFIACFIAGLGGLLALGIAAYMEDRQCRPTQQPPHV